ncbi:MAG: DNA alkylation repair protein [Akkermansiaceae bacterium]
MEPFKNELSFANVAQLARVIEEASDEFSREIFFEGLERELEALELKGRVRCVAERIESAISVQPPRLFEILREALVRDTTLQGFVLWPFTEVVARRGLDHFEESMNALRAMTPRYTAEFAVRPFLLKHESRTFRRLHEWCDDPNEHVRRLVSEGSRPLLPWGMRLPSLMVKPELGLALLERLYDDPSEYVRLSVSNHLNDFSKAHPELVLDTLKRWRSGGSISRELDKLSRHASRTLLKQGNPDALSLHGYADADSFELQEFRLENSDVRVGEKLRYLLVIRNRSDREQKLLFDYAIHHRKANGSLSPKVFKGRVRVLASGEEITIEGAHSFREVTTRRYYSGGHRFEPQINGRAWPAVDFGLLV